MFRYVRRILFGLLLAGCAFDNPSPASAADANNGKTLAERWCSNCHVVSQGQKSATDQAPPFASIARMPDFGATMLTFLLLKPHPSMPRLELSRTEAADLADYIATVK